MCDLAGVIMDTLYRKIDFIHQRCLSFAAVQESRLPGMSIRRLYLSVDRQDRMINWMQADDKRNIVLNAVGTADNKSGYIFGIHVNYDADIDGARVELEANANGDNDIPAPFRNMPGFGLRRSTKTSLAK